jgi:hypothetical protein
MLFPAVADHSTLTTSAISVVAGIAASTAPSPEPSTWTYLASIVLTGLVTALVTQFTNRRSNKNLVLEAERLRAETARIREETTSTALANTVALLDLKDREIESYRRIALELEETVEELKVKVEELTKQIQILSAVSAQRNIVDGEKSDG